MFYTAQLASWLLDVLQTIDAYLGSTFSYSTRHTLARPIGGELLLIDSPDFVIQASVNFVSVCVASLARADSPAEDGVAYSWNLRSSFPNPEKVSRTESI
jgi:hypothetical protein